MFGRLYLTNRCLASIVTFASYASVCGKPHCFVGVRIDLFGTSTFEHIHQRQRSSSPIAVALQPWLTGKLVFAPCSHNRSTSRWRHNCGFVGPWFAGAWFAGRTGNPDPTSF